MKRIMYLIFASLVMTPSAAMAEAPLNLPLEQQNVPVIAFQFQEEIEQAPLHEELEEADQDTSIAVGPVTITSGSSDKLKWFVSVQFGDASLNAGNTSDGTAYINYSSGATDGKSNSGWSLFYVQSNGSVQFSTYDQKSQTYIIIDAGGISGPITSPRD